MITASALARVMACPGSEALPHVNRTSENAEAGTARHQYLASIGKLGASAALAQVPEKYQDMCADIDLEGLPTNLASEVAFAYNWRTGEARELGRDLDRDYSACGPDEIAGTIDVIGVSPDMLYIGDYKGFSLVKAKNNAQLLFAALCASKVYERDSATIEIINIRGAKNWRDKATVDYFDLAEFASKLKATMLKVEVLQVEALQGKEPSVTEGDHCKYCPAFDACPAKTKMLISIVGGLDIETMTAETARKAYDTWRAMKEMTAAVGARIYAYAAQNPIELDDGMVLGSRTKQGNESLDGDATYLLVKERLGQEFADVAVSRKASKKGLTAAVRMAKESGKITGAQKAEVDSLVTELRASGAATKKSSVVVDEHKVKKELK